MLKKLTFIVILIVLFKPAYEYGTKLFNDVNQYLNHNSIDISDAANELITTVSTGVSDLSSTVSKMIAIDSKSSELPTEVKSVEDLADAFYHYFSRWETNFEIHYVGSTSDIENIIDRAINEATSRDQYIEGHLADRRVEYEYGVMDAKIKVDQQYLTNPEQEKIVDEKVAQILSAVDPNTMSDFQKVKFVNDYIVKNTAYSEESSASPHSAFAVVHEGKGVCQGYALLALKMLQQLGVETKYVVGEVYTGGHAWNLVKVDGEWYHLDTTWNDPVPDRGNTISYQYFLINDAQMKLDHTWIQANYPTATNEKYAFMKQVDHAYEVNGYMYYSNVEDNNLLYRVNPQTGVSEKVTNSRAQYIVGHGDWLYFSNYSNGAYLTKIKTNGTEESILYQTEVKNLFVEDGYLFFSTPDGLKKMALE
ncbi:S-layer protein [Ureibacillus massiliensis 4400831 = CIP 108448 = CCUG 49529]|uniref:S-layer protein n=1 Tax=Ureibacillus massiliensis 4400831 = CIP 108448 = CCUG 49529 TaxID=1211035 RepID=A0A0A3J3L7_9BACL|nr:transglutaminase domain-containing protein [Ureibacillus massiliensis]KGR89758.1 S-layer protein [Ureibacillus massiliensis 4400831 = CIP 108448 = CCUG 49529]